LDFAQIKSGKFRINIKPINIHEMLEKVMAIQREKANEAELKLVAETTNISKISQEGLIQKSVKKYSPVVYTDEQRVM